MVSPMLWGVAKVFWVFLGHWTYGILYPLSKYHESDHLSNSTPFLNKPCPINSANNKENVTCWRLILRVSGLFKPLTLKYDKP